MLYLMELLANLNLADMTVALAIVAILIFSFFIIVVIIAAYLLDDIC